MQGHLPVCSPHTGSACLCCVTTCGPNLTQTVTNASMKRPTAILLGREYKGCNTAAYWNFKCFLKAIPFHPKVQIGKGAGQHSTMSSARLCDNGAASRALLGHAWHLQRSQIVCLSP